MSFFRIDFSTATILLTTNILSLVWHADSVMCKYKVVANHIIIVYVGNHSNVTIIVNIYLLSGLSQTSSVKTVVLILASLNS